jgi:DNA-directed RNA polymerase specialized sigma24 family protein
MDKSATVKNSSIHKVERKKDWTLNQRAFHQLLVWLDEGKDSEGRGYLEMRRRLVVYFDRKNCLAPEELADETLNRVARRLEEEGAITSNTPARYCYIMAKFVFLEYLRGTAHTEVSLSEQSALEAQSTAASTLGAGELARKDELTGTEDRAHKEKMLDCLDRCSQQLEPQNRELIFQYYNGEQRVKIDNRRALAARLGLTMNALSIRACRIRDKLEACVTKCSAEE